MTALPQQHEDALGPQLALADLTSASLIDRAARLKIDNDTSLKIAGELLVQIKGEIKCVEAQWEPLVKSAHATHKLATALRNNEAEPLIAAEASLKKMIADYQVAQAKAMREAEERMTAQLQAEAREAGVAPEQLSGLAVVAPPPAKVAGVSTRVVWKHRIIDEALIPREYLVPNEKAIAGVVASLGPQAKIPGVEVYEDTIVSARA